MEREQELTLRSTAPPAVSVLHTVLANIPFPPPSASYIAQSSEFVPFIPPPSTPPLCPSGATILLVSLATTALYPGREKYGTGAVELVEAEGEGRTKYHSPGKEASSE